MNIFVYIFIIIQHWKSAHHLNSQEDHSNHHSNYDTYWWSDDSRISPSWDLIMTQNICNIPVPTQGYLDFTIWQAILITKVLSDIDIPL